MRYKLLNSAMMPRINLRGRYTVEPLTQEQFAAKIRGAADIESYIGYPDTAEFVTWLTGRSVPVSREQTVIEDGDRILIIRLKYRLTDPGDKGRIRPKPEDFEYAEILYEKIADKD